MLRPTYHTHATCVHLWLQTCTCARNVAWAFQLLLNWFSSASPPTPLQLLQAKTKPSLLFRTSPPHAFCASSELSSVILFFSTKLLPRYLLAAPSIPVFFLHFGQFFLISFLLDPSPLWTLMSSQNHGIHSTLAVPKPWYSRRFRTFV